MEKTKNCVYVYLILLMSAPLMIQAQVSDQGEVPVGAEKAIEDDQQLIDQLDELNKDIGKGNFEVYVYSPKGRRNPFEQPFSDKQVNNQDNLEIPAVSKQGLESYDVGSFLVTSILWRIKEPKALFKDPTGKTHVIKEGVRVGRKNGYVAKIREGEVIVIEKESGFSGDEEGKYKTQVLKIGR